MFVNNARRHQTSAHSTRKLTNVYYPSDRYYRRQMRSPYERRLSTEKGLRRVSARGGQAVSGRGYYETSLGRSGRRQSGAYRSLQDFSLVERQDYIAYRFWGRFENQRRSENSFRVRRRTDYRGYYRGEESISFFRMVSSTNFSSSLSVIVLSKP